MTHNVPLAKNRHQGIDDAVYLDRAIDAYKEYFSGLFTGSWPEAYDKHQADQTQIDLVAGELDAPEGAVILVTDYDNGLDDAHYLNWAVEVYHTAFSEDFRAAWPGADEAPIAFVQGTTVEGDPGDELPDIDISLPDPPKPTQLPANQAPPKPTQY